MRNISSNWVRKQGKRELRAVFKALRFVDGLTAEQELNEPKAEDFVYYYNKARDGQVGNYIVYEVIASDPTRRADDKVIGREFFAQVDVFSTSSFESKLLNDTLAKIEDALTDKGFEVDTQAEDYEPDTRLYHQAYFITKQYF